MRDPKRIPKVLKEIEKSWSKYPDLRFCQWLHFITKLDDPFYLEDDELIKLIRREH